MAGFIGLSVALWTLSSAALGAPPRLALVIGNADYQFATKLQNSLNDVRDVTQDLEAVGFVVTRVEDVTLNGLIDAVDAFVGELHRKGGVGLLYYSGHGVQVAGQNYLVPVDARLKRKSRIKYEAYALDDALSPYGANIRTNRMILISENIADNLFVQ